MTLTSEELLNAVEPDRLLQILSEAPGTPGTHKRAFEMIVSRRPIANLYDFWRRPNANAGQSLRSAVYFVIERLTVEHRRALLLADAEENGPLFEQNDPIVAWINDTPIEQLEDAIRDFAPSAVKRAISAIRVARPLLYLSELRELSNCGRTTMRAIEGAAAAAGVVPEPPDPRRLCPHCGLSRGAGKVDWHYRMRPASISLRTVAARLSKGDREELERLLCMLERSALITPHGAASAPKTTRADLRALCLQAIEELDKQAALRSEPADPRVREVIVTFEVVTDGARQLLHRARRDFKPDNAQQIEAEAVAELARVVQERHAREARAAEAVAAEFGHVARDQP